MLKKVVENELKNESIKMQATLPPYNKMILQVFIDVFNKQKKYRDHGVTYQMIWKEVDRKYNLSSGDRAVAVKKDIVLKRIKKLTSDGENAADDISKNGGGYLKRIDTNRYVYSNSQREQAHKKREVKQSQKQ